MNSNNIQTGNLPLASSTTNEPTTNYFNNYFITSNNISSDKNTMLISFFEEWTGDKECGKTLAATVLYTAQNQGINTTDLLDELRKLDKKQLNAYLTLFLNLNRIGTSLLGISNVPQTNKYIQRAILP